MGSQSKKPVAGPDAGPDAGDDTQNANRSYDIGYGKPPTGTRFAKGKSGNPNGRPKGTRAPEGVFRRVLDRKIPVTLAGHTRQMSVREGLVLRVRELAKAGDPRALQWVWLTLGRTDDGQDKEQLEWEAKGARARLMAKLTEMARRHIVHEQGQRNEKRDEHSER